MQNSKKTILVVVGIFLTPFAIYFYEEVAYAFMLLLAAIFLFIFFIAAEGLPARGGGGGFPMFVFKSNTKTSKGPKPRGERRARLSGGDKYGPGQNEN